MLPDLSNTMYMSTGAKQLPPLVPLAPLVPEAPPEAPLEHGEAAGDHHDARETGGIPHH